MSSDSTSLNARASDDYAPVPPAQIDAQTAAATTTTTNIEDPPTDKYVPVPPALVAEQTAAAYDEMDAAIKETVEVIQSLRTNPPIPPAQTAAAYDDMEDNENDDDAPLPRYYDPDDLAPPAAQNQKPRAKTGIDNSQGVDAPIPPAQIGDQYNAMENIIKSMEDNEFDDDASLHPSIAAAGLDDDEENQYQKLRARTGANENDDAARMAPATPTSGKRGEATALPVNQRSSNERPSSSTHPINNPQRRTSFWRRSQRQRQPVRIPRQPQQSAPSEVTIPPTLPPPNLDATSPTNNNEENPPIPVLEATLVVESPPAPIYDATPITSTHSPRWKRYRNYSVITLVAVMATVIALQLITGDNGNKVDTQPLEQTSIGTTPPQDTQPPTTLAPTSRPALSPMEQLQSSALELVPSEAIVSHDARENVAMYGDTLIVGAPENNNGRGFALVYIRDDKGKWSQQAKLEAPDGADGDRFGFSVAIHGNTAIVGAYRDDDYGMNSGSVDVFVRNGGTWMHQAKLLTPDGVADDWFGFSVGIYDDTVIIGAPCNGGRGSAHLFVQKNGIWMHQAKLTAPDGSAYNSFGYSVGIFDDTVIVGAPYSDEKGSWFGSVHLFALNQGIWHQARLLAPDGAADDQFGVSVGIFGDTVVVGAPWDDDNGSRSGSAQVFALDNNIWTHQAKIVAPDGAADDRFGWSVGIYMDTVVVGSERDDDNGFNSGSLHLFTRNEGAWDYDAKLLAPNTVQLFGRGVVTYNDTVVAGSYSGEVYVF